MRKGRVQRVKGSNMSVSHHSSRTLRFRTRAVHSLTMPMYWHLLNSVQNAAKYFKVLITYSWKAVCLISGHHGSSIWHLTKSNGSLTQVAQQQRRRQQYLHKKHVSASQRRALEIWNRRIHRQALYRSRMVRPHSSFMTNRCSMVSYSLRSWFTSFNIDCTQQIPLYMNRMKNSLTSLTAMRQQLVIADTICLDIESIVLHNSLES